MRDYTGKRRNMKHALVIGALFAASTLWAASANAAQSDAELILYNGNIRTPGGAVKALAVDGKGLIVALGDLDEVAPSVSGKAQRIDLSGATVLPGFHDLHVHPWYAGLRESDVLKNVCRFKQGSSLETVQARIKECVEKAKPGEWITGGRWDAPALGGVPNRKLLDEVAPDNPIFLDDTSGHSGWSNTKALEVAGLTKDTPDPDDGIIERDTDGTPTGVLRETAQNIVRKHIPTPTRDEHRDVVAWSLEKMLSYGITSFTEAAGSPEAAQAYQDLADNGTLKQRVRFCTRWTPGNEAAEKIISNRNFYARERLSFDCVKIVLDGVPTDSHTAAMVEPYGSKMEGRDDEAARKGMLLVKQDTLNKAVARFDKMGLGMKIHSAGDAAVRASLDAIEYARHQNGYSGVLHDVAHCTFVHKKDIGRARDLGATFEVSPYLWGPTPINDSITAAIGDKRIERVWPVREMLDAGQPVVAGSDWSVVPSVNPWIGVETLVSRRAPGGGEKTFGANEAISIEQAIDLFTVNAARHERMQDKLGVIGVGMIADLVVLDADPYTTKTEDLHNTKVLKTIINGEIVYEGAK